MYDGPSRALNYTSRHLPKPVDRRSMGYLIHIVCGSLYSLIHRLPAAEIRRYLFIV